MGEARVALSDNRSGGEGQPRGSPEPLAGTCVSRGSQAGSDGAAERHLHPSGARTLRAVARHRSAA